MNKIYYSFPNKFIFFFILNLLLLNNVKAAGTIITYKLNKDSDNTDKQLVKCVSKECTTKIIAKEGFYIDEESRVNDVYTKLIECTSNNSKITCVSSVAYSGIRIDAGSYNDENKKYEQLIKCTENNSHSQGSSSSSQSDISLGSSSGSQSGSQSGISLGSSSGDQNVGSSSGDQSGISLGSSSGDQSVGSSSGDQSDISLGSSSGDQSGISLGSSSGDQSVGSSSGDQSVGSSSGDQSGISLGSSSGNCLGSSSGSQCIRNLNKRTATVNCSYLKPEVTGNKVIHYLVEDSEETDSVLTCDKNGCIREIGNKTGYFINSGTDNKIIICEDNNCDIFEKDELLINSNCYEPGGLMEKDGYIYLCISNDNNDSHVKVVSSIDIEGYPKYLTFSNVDNDYPDFPGILANSKFSVKIDNDGSIKLTEVDNKCNLNNGSNCISNSYYLINSEKNTIVKYGNEEGNLFYCENENEKCKQINNVGYYIDDYDTIYACSIYNTKLLCKIDNYSNDCNDETIGNIIYNDQKFSICLNSGLTVNLNENNNGNYILNKGHGNIFINSDDEMNYALININEKDIILNTKGLKYVYIYKSVNENHKIMKNTDTCPEDDNGIIKNEIFELICNKEGKCKENELEN